MRIVREWMSHLTQSLSIKSRWVEHPAYELFLGLKETTIDLAKVAGGLPVSKKKRRG
jgi:hypothetical protein